MPSNPLAPGCAHGPAPLLLIAVLCLMPLLIGCAANPVDWGRVHAVAIEVDQTAAVWEQVLDEDEAATVRRIRDAGRPVITAIAARASDPAADDPTEQLHAWLTIAGDVIATWPDERQRQIAAATWSTARLAMALAGVGLPPPTVPDSEGGG